jgi:osmoprotectant transport system permease protein
MGMTNRQLLMLVQLPLALPVMMAGIRTSTVISVGVATLASPIGAGGLGDQIFQGIHMVDNNMIFAGAIPAALLALVLDGLLGLLERKLTPGSSPKRKATVTAVGGAEHL